MTVVKFEKFGLLTYTLYIDILVFRDQQTTNWEKANKKNLFSFQIVLAC